MYPMIYRTAFQFPVRKDLSKSESTFKY